MIYTCCLFVILYIKARRFSTNTYHRCLSGCDVRQGRIIEPMGKNKEAPNREVYKKIFRKKIKRSRRPFQFYPLEYCHAVVRNFFFSFFFSNWQLGQRRDNLSLSLDVESAHYASTLCVPYLLQLALGSRLRMFTL